MTTNTLTVGLGDRSYVIHAGLGLLASSGEICRQTGLRGTAALISNSTVAPLYGELVTASLERAGYKVLPIILPDGEEYKTAETLEAIYDSLIEGGLNRGAFIVALGGGVVGDMAGYAAATFLRGIPFVQIPTTLLAQVDSSVGGKTGINHRLGKNLIGAFYQPRAVIIDLETLNTLLDREYLCGLGEVLKYGVALDKELFELIGSAAEDVKSRNPGVMLDIIVRCCTIKASVVERDERESGLRAVLNYGHTIGHAVETLAGYGTIKHGEAVAIGMAQIAGLSALKGYCTVAEAERIVSLIRELGLPTALPVYPAADYARIIEHDKKKRDDGVTFIFNRGIGNYLMEKITDVPAILRDCGVEI